MNRNCHGWFMPELKAYRCFADGGVSFELDHPPTMCPSCGRPVHATTLTNVQLQETTLISVNIPYLGWATLTSKTVPLPLQEYLND